MAIVSNFTCSKCGEDRTEMVPWGNMSDACGVCRQKEANEMKRRHLKGLEGLTTEERLRKIEEWIYDYKPVYVPPPRF